METKSKTKAIQKAQEQEVVAVTEVAKPQIVVKPPKKVKTVIGKPDAVAKAKQARDLAAKLESEKVLSHEKLAADFLKEQSLLR
jgi:hypothetical protein